MSFPHGSEDTGISFKRFSATGLNSDGLTLLPANGWPSVICLPPLQAGDVICVKSPCKVEAVSTYAIFEVGTRLSYVPWYPAKKNSLFLSIGPPTSAPNWLRFRPSVFVAKKFRALRS